MRSERVFRIALVFSLAAHGVVLALETGDTGDAMERTAKIPVRLVEEPPPPPSPPPPPKPKPPEPQKKPKKKPRPQKLVKPIKKVVETQDQRAAEVVDTDAGDYTEEVAPAPEPPPPPPPPPPKPKPKVDKVKLARAFLGKLRAELMNEKRYPLSARRSGVTGAVAVSFSIMPDSTFSEIQLKRSSGHGVLDGAALETVRKLSGKLRRPSDLGAVPLKTSVVLRYELSG